MKNKVPDRIPPKPGFAEAIHAEIGNGASWETDQHSFLLRSPDPTKDLDNQLSDIDTDLVFIPDHSTNEVPFIGEEQASSEITMPSDLAAIKEVIPKETVESTIQEENFNPTTSKKGKEKIGGKKKTKTREPEKNDDSALTNQEGALKDHPKVPKAGKLIRKAAKSVRKHEEEEQKPIAPNLALTESTLSPYTQWLKALKGSEYVHPYDDDFAFVQGSGPAKEGISETFAELLASQGYKEQAVEMYMKLMEKYPEKSGFFAAKIEALQ